MLTELLKHAAFSAQRLSLWHYRTQTNTEVDFILENRLGQISGIEVKASATVDGEDSKGLRHLRETESPIFQCGIVLYAGREVEPFGENCGPFRCPSGGPSTLRIKACQHDPP